MPAADDRELAAAIELAMHAEAEAEAFYTRAGESTGDPRGRDMFAQLARFEHHHYVSLQRLHEALRGDFPGYQAAAALLPERPSAAPLTLGEQQRKNDVDALTIAIAAETKAAASYRDLSARALADAVKKMFAKLAEEEELHRKVLEDQFFALTNASRWNWGD
jgi:rubrerythrin